VTVVAMPPREFMYPKKRRRALFLGIIRNQKQRISAAHIASPTQLHLSAL
jgi:hypothetical protein